MELVIPDLYASAPQPLPFAPAPSSSTKPWIATTGQPHRGATAAADARGRIESILERLRPDTHAASPTRSASTWAAATRGR